MTELIILNCGEKVVPKYLNVEATITGVCIRFGHVTYEVSYFNNGEHKQVWLNEGEFHIEEETEKTKIGFKYK